MNVLHCAFKLRRFCSSLLVATVLTVPAARGVELQPIAVGEWSSQWPDGLRGRLLLFKRWSIPHKWREMLVFVELENRTTGRLFEVYFAPENLRCELRDGGGEAVPARQMSDHERKLFERRQPTSCWITLPDASALRLRVSPYCRGVAENVGLLIPLGDASWLIEAGDTGDYFLSGVLTVSPPTNHGRADAWHGALRLPKAKITLGRP